MSHFADDETIELIARLQATVQEQAAEIESLQTSLILVKNSVTWRGNKIADLQHKVKVLTDALESLHWMDKNSKVRLALATVKGET